MCHIMYGLGSVNCIVVLMPKGDVGNSIVNELRKTDLATTTV